MNELLSFDSVGFILEWTVIGAVPVRTKGSGAVRTEPLDLQAFVTGLVSYFSTLTAV